MLNAMNHPNNLQELLKNSAEKFGERVALSEFVNGALSEITYKTLHEYALIGANNIVKTGLQPGENIAIKGSNSISWVVRFFSILYSGCTVVPIDPKLNKKSIDFILKFTNSYLLEDVIKEQDRDKISNLKTIDSGSVAEILFTSGTTGEPKGVMLTHKNLISNLIDINKIIYFDYPVTSFSILPLHHVYELTGGLLNNIYNGNKVHFCSKIDISTMTKEMQIVKPAIWPVVPLILEKIFKGIKSSLQKSIMRQIIFNIAPKIFGRLVRKKMGLENVKFILCGGAPLNPEIEKFLDRINIQIIQGYGLSEASPLITVNPPEKIKFGSVGKVIDSCAVEIRKKNEDGHGIIYAKGSNIFKGYYKNLESTQEVLENGWLNTGDIGYFDSDQYLYITGREKFVIVNAGGKNIYPEEIEENIKTSNLIKDVVVFSNDDKNIIAIIQPDEFIFKNTDIDELKRVISNYILDSNKNFESYKRINKVYLTNKDFNKTSTQKIKRDFLRNFNPSDYDLAY